MTASKKDRNDKVKRASSWRYESTHYILPKNRSRLPTYGESHKQYAESNQGNDLTDISSNFGVHQETLLNSSNIQNINNSTIGGSSQSRNQESYRSFNHECDDSVRDYANVFQSEKMSCRRKESMHKRQSSNFSIVQLAENSAKIPMQISIHTIRKIKIKQPIQLEEFILARTAIENPFKMKSLYPHFLPLNQTFREIFKIVFAKVLAYVIMRQRNKCTNF